MPRLELADPAFSPRRVLLRAPNPLGDAIMAEPAMRAIAARFPQARVDVALPQALAPLGAGWAFVDEVLAVPRGSGASRIAASLTTAGAWRARGYDLCVLFPNSLGSAATARLAGIARRAGYARDARAWLLSDPIATPQRPRALHMIAYYGGIAAALGCPPLAPPAGTPADAIPAALAADPGTAPRLIARPAMQDAAQALLQLHGLGDAPFIALAPGAAYGPAKQWPIEHFVALAAGLARDTGRRIVVVGTAAERPLGAAIAAGADAVDLTGATDLAGLIGVLARASAFVGNDAGSAHVAGALGVPGVVIYGSTSDAHSGQVGRDLRIAHLRLQCSPCFARECPLGHLKCLRELSPALVRTALAPLLASESRPKAG